MEHSQPTPEADRPVVEMVEQWRRERPDLDPAPMALFGRLTRADAVAGRAIAGALAEHGLNRGEFDVLATLRRSGEPYRMQAGQLAAAMLLSAAAMTNRLDRLERAGLVRRESDPGDRRAVVVALTDAGVARVEAAVTDHVENETRLLAGLSPSERRQLSQLLAALLASVETAVAAGSRDAPPR